MMSGITFPELTEFMNERIEFWKAYDLMMQTRDEAEENNPELRERRLLEQTFGTATSKKLKPEEAALEKMSMLAPGSHDEQEEDEQ